MDSRKSFLLSGEAEVVTPEENVKVVIGRVGGYSYKQVADTTLKADVLTAIRKDDKVVNSAELDAAERVVTALLEKYQINQRLLDNKPTTPYNDMIKRK